MPEQPAATAPYVFLSYASADRDQALAIADALAAAGTAVWLDRRSLVGGMSWDAAIVRAIKECAVFAVLCSPAAIVSPNVMQELRLAWEEQRPTLPLRLAMVAFPDEMRYVLAGRQWVDVLDEPGEVWLPAVLQALDGLGLTSRPLPAAVVPEQARPPTNLPTPLSSFLGREEDVAALGQLLATHRLVTLTGPGGIGKTRLAVEAARAHLRTFADGAFLVNLAPIRDPDLLPITIAHALDLPDVADQPLLQRLQLVLHNKALLLVLDNFEQLVGAASVVSELLEACPRLRVLITSRAILHLTGERSYPVPPLALSDAAHLPPLAELAHQSAVALFVQRAQAVRPDFVLTAENAATIAAICQQLDGLPLALELAAARIRLATPQLLLSRLEHRLSFLTGGARNLPLRQQTLRDTIAWSYDLLSPDEQWVFRRLAVFEGGCTVEAVEAVCASGAPHVDGLAVCEALVLQSLLQEEPGPDGVPRLRLLATIREFGRDQLEHHGERASAQQAHAAYFLTLLEASESRFVAGEGQALHRRLLAEPANLRAAWRWWVDRGETEAALRLVGALYSLYILSPVSNLLEGGVWVGTALQLPGAAARTPFRAKALLTAGAVAFGHTDFSAGRAYCAESAAIWHELGEQRWEGVARSMESMCTRDDPTAALAAAETSRALLGDTGTPWDRVAALVALGVAHLQLGHAGEAETALRAALDVGHSQAVRHYLAPPLYFLGNLAEARADYATAHSCYEQGVALLRAVGDTLNLVYQLERLGLVVLHEGDSGRARALLRESLQLRRELGIPAGIAMCLEACAQVVATLGRPSVAARYCGAADAIRTRVGLSALDTTNAFRSATVAAVQATLGPAAFAAAWTAGQALDLDTVVAEALSELAPA